MSMQLGETPADAELPPEQRHRSCREGLWGFVRGSPGAERLELDGGLAIRTDVPSRLTNALYVLSTPSDAHRLLEQAHAYFGRRFWRLITTDAVSSQIEQEARRWGMSTSHGDPGMLLSPIPRVPAPPADLHVVPATDRGSLRDFTRACAQGFGLPTFAVRAVLGRSPPAPSGDIPVVFLVGYRGAAPVATSATVVTDRTAGIFMVSTVPKERRRGFGEAATWSAVEWGRQRGCDTAYLEATRMGAPVYEKMGFRMVEEYPEWSSDPKRGSRAWALGWVFRHALLG
jgi:N-acetylglutamate synthase